MALNIVYPFGEASVSVAASSKIAVISATPAIVDQLVGYANIPSSWDNLTTTTANTEYVSGAMSAAATVRIQAGPAPVYYQVGTAPTTNSVEINRQVTPTAKTTAATLTIAELLTGIITATHTAGATVAYTLPTGTDTDAALTFATNDSFDWSLINLSAAAADTITLTANTAHTIVGNAIVQSVHATTGLIYGSSALFRTRKTAANTFVTYRIA